MLESLRESFGVLTNRLWPVQFQSKVVSDNANSRGGPGAAESVAAQHLINPVFDGFRQQFGAVRIIRVRKKFRQLLGRTQRNADGHQSPLAMLFVMEVASTENRVGARVLA